MDNGDPRRTQAGRAGDALPPAAGRAPASTAQLHPPRRHCRPAEGLVQRRFTVIEPDRLYAADITQHRTE
jgi:hypothetical protein